MEKLLYLLWEPKDDALGHLPKKLAELGASNIRLNLRDQAVEPAAALAQSRGDEQAGAVVQFWLRSTNDIFRETCDQLVSKSCAHYHSWLVSESTIIANEDYTPKRGERAHGFAQLAFLTLPDGMTWQDWRKVWRDGHTQVAIDTQSNFEYVQNLIVEPLTEGAPPYVAMVEECFPAEAMTDPFVFFDAEGDQAKFDQNLAAMMESCSRFISPGTIDVFPTSQFNF